jgi:hypothetical protein
MNYTKKDFEREWYPIPDYEGLYEINKDGVVRSLDKKVLHNSKSNAIAQKRGKILAQSKGNRGYMCFGVHKDGCYRTLFTHRLLASLFIENINNKSTVNHINGVKSDNRLCNLEWCTQQENVIHAYKNGLIKLKKGAENKLSKLVLDLSTGIFYEGVREAAISKGLVYGTLVNRLNGRKPNNTNLIYV